MKSEKFATIKNGKVALLTDGYPEHELTADQMPLTSNEYWLLKSVNADLELAEMIIRDLRDRIEKMNGEKQA